MKHFKYSEFDQDGLSGTGQRYMDRYFLFYLDIVRERLEHPIIIVSGYRSPNYNEAVSDTGTNGVHTKGLAADLLIPVELTYRLLEIVFSMGVFTGIGIRKSKNGKQVIHLDIAKDDYPRPRVWGY